MCGSKSQTSLVTHALWVACPHLSQDQTNEQKHICSFKVYSYCIDLQDSCPRFLCKQTNQYGSTDSSNTVDIWSQKLPLDSKAPQTQRKKLPSRTSHCLEDLALSACLLDFQEATEKAFFFHQVLKFISPWGFLLFPRPFYAAFNTISSSLLPLAFYAIPFYCILFVLL